MNKKNSTYLGIAIVVILVAAVILLRKPKSAPSDSSNTGNDSAPHEVANKVPNTMPGATPGSMTIAVEKVEGSKIYFFTTTKQEQYITVTTATNITLATMVKGTVQNTPIQLSDIKPKQLLEVTTGTDLSVAKTIRVLK